MKMNRSLNLGMTLLAIYLILTGLMQVVEFPIPGIVMAVLAIASGILILMNK